MVIQDGRNPDLYEMPILGSLEDLHPTLGLSWRDLLEAASGADRHASIYQVYSDPTREDSDGDGLSDRRERS